MSLDCNAVTVRYRDRVAVRPTSIKLARGNVVALVGPNGAGKSSLLKAIAGLVPCTGTVRGGEHALSSNPRARARTIAYLPQSPAAHWPIRVRDLVALGRLPHRVFGAAPRPERNEPRPEPGNAPRNAPGHGPRPDARPEPAKPPVRGFGDDTPAFLLRPVKVS